MTKFLIFISQDVKEKAKQEAKKRGMSLSAFIRMIIIEKLYSNSNIILKDRKNETTS